MEKACLMVFFWGGLAEPFKSRMPYWHPEESLEEYINLALNLRCSAFRVELAVEPAPAREPTEPTPFLEPTESAPEPAPFLEPTESAPEPTPFHEPTESAPEPAPFLEPTESAPEPTPFHEPTESAPEPAPFCELFVVGAVCSPVYSLSPPILLPNHCFSCPTCVSLVTLVCLPI